MTTAEKPNPPIELIPASLAEQPVLANLLELYIHDFSEFLPCELGEDGRFGYKNLSAYWREPHHFPFLVRLDGRLAGFVFVRELSRTSNDHLAWDMAEFFIVRGHRRCGIGTALACAVFQRFPGQWQVRVMEPNQPARQFWASAIHQFTGQAIPSAGAQINAQNWHVFSFESKPE